jgi:hypothetical protein
MSKDLNSLKREAEQHVREGDYGLFRNSLYKLGEIKYESDDLENAFMYWMCCCYLDINGPNNTSGGIDDSLEFYKEMKLWSEWEHYYFNPENHGNLAPALIHTLKEHLQNGDYELEEYHDIFMENAIELLEDLNTLIAPTPAWKKLKEKLEG